MTTVEITFTIDTESSDAALVLAKALTDNCGTAPALERAVSALCSLGVNVHPDEHGWEYRAKLTATRTSAPAPVQDDPPHKTSKVHNHNETTYVPTKETVEHRLLKHR